MKRIRQSDYVAMPWKNGMGVTHEICSSDVGGTILWRLSLAEVQSDGPFSTFENLERITTVIEGLGMRLASADNEIDALPLKPINFSGDIALTGYCNSTPIRNFNLIFDPKRIVADVQVLTKPSETDLSCPVGVTLAVYLLDCASASDSMQEPRKGDTYILNPGDQLESCKIRRCISVHLMHR